MAQNRIVVYWPHDAENDLEGGYNWQHRVAFCDVDEEKGMLTWDRVVFPDIRAVATAGNREEDRAPMISRSNPRTSHVSSMDVVGDDVLDFLRENGVEVVMLGKEEAFKS